MSIAFRLSTLFSIIILLLVLPMANGQSEKDTALSQLSDISKAYQSGKLPEKEYLDSMHSSMKTILRKGINIPNKELLGLLGTYRATIWSNANNEDRKQDYYSTLSNQAQLEGNLGEMRYYAEKINELERKKSKQPSIAALTIIADYYNTLWSFKNTKDLYITNRTFILNIPKSASETPMKINQLVQSSIMLGKFGEALFELNDTLHGLEVKTTLGQIAAIAQQKYGTQYFELAHIEFSKLLIDLYIGNATKRNSLIRKSLQQLAEFNLDEHNPANLKQASVFTIADAKINLFLDEKNVDSAAFYLAGLTSLIGPEPSLYNQYMLQKYKSRLLYEQGQYKNSIDTLVAAMLVSEQIRKDIVKDVNEMMYAQAASEEQEILVKELEHNRNKSEQQLLIAGGVIVFLVFSGLLYFLYIRRRQRSSFIEFKLNMARSIHDETGPALLYAQALAKTNRSGAMPDNKSELEKQIEHTMEVIRHLSHDLKSDKLVTLADLTSETRNTLKKLNPNQEFSFVIEEDFNKKQFISHHQYTHLRAILNECITNSIKHATFKNIRIYLKQSGNKLTLGYNDDGKGLNCDATKEVGIGIKNMEERVLQLNGNWTMDNHYPEGYNIVITLTLR